jgi:hypothetical protein
MSARTRIVSAVIRSVSAPPVLRIDVVGPDPHQVLLLWSSAGWGRSSSGPLLLDPRVIREAASWGRGSPHSESLGLECACLAADRPRRAALRVSTPELACCVAGWSPPGGRARSESVLAPCSMLAWPVSIELILDLPFSHLSNVAVKHPSRLGRLVLHLKVPPSQVTVSPSSPVTQTGDTSLSEMSRAFWLMHWVPVPSKFNIGEMVCCDCSESSIVTFSGSLIF